MARIIIIGAGLSGLAAALFLGRRGHQVDLFERDPDAPPGDREGCFAHWKRRGAPQIRQAHNFLGLSSRVLAEEAPDVLDALKSSGVFQASRWPSVSDPFAYSLFARRPIYEALLREAVERQGEVRLHRAIDVAGLIARSGGEVPHVVGVRLGDGSEADADLVVDASGRWTKAAEWLSALGARSWIEDLQETPLAYLTRWYRLNPGETYPPVIVPAAAPIPYLLTIAFPADNGCFAIAMAASMTDPLRGTLLEPEVFAAYLDAVPAIQAWASRGTPITDPLPLARINNCRRRLTDEAGPIVTGFVMLGDSGNHTNPTYGRGVSLGFAQAQHLARTAETAASPVAFALSFSEWTDANVGSWRDSQQEADGFLLTLAQATIAGEMPPRPPPQFRFRQAMGVLADRDAEVAELVAQEQHLLCPAGAADADPAVSAKVRAFMEQAPRGPAVAGPSRREFEALVAAHASGRRGKSRGRLA